MVVNQSKLINVCEFSPICGEANNIHKLVTNATVNLKIYVLARLFCVHNFAWPVKSFSFYGCTKYAGRKYDSDHLQLRYVPTVSFDGWVVHRM